MLQLLVLLVQCLCNVHLSFRICIQNVNIGQDRCLREWLFVLDAAAAAAGVTIDFE